MSACKAENSKRHLCLSFRRIRQMGVSFPKFAMIQTNTYLYSDNQSQQRGGVKHFSYWYKFVQRVEASSVGKR